MKFIFDPSLVLYLPLYQLGGASFKSQDAHGHLCTVTGARWQSDGRYFDGLDDVIDCGSNPSLESTTWTIETWIYRQANSGEYERIVCKGTVNVNDYWIQIDNTEHFKAGFKTGGTGKEVATSITASIQTWYHFVATLDGTLKIFVDMVERASIDYSAFTPNTNVSPLNIGRLGNGGTWFYKYNGLIGEVRLYRRALTPQEIQRNYLSTKWRYQ